jgi:hypothetical protein
MAALNTYYAESPAGPFQFQLSLRLSDSSKISEASSSSRPHIDDTSDPE